MRLRDFVSVVKEAAVAWKVDKASRLGAALAYYAAFSIGPLLLLTVAVVGMVFGRDATEGRLAGQLRGVMGNAGAEAIQSILAHGKNMNSEGVAAIAGIAMLLFGATGLFIALQDALNTVWELRPPSGRGFVGIVRDRFLSFVMVMGVALLLLITLIISSTLPAMTRHFNGATWGVVGQAVDPIASLSLLTLLFAMIFKYLPDATVSWKDVGFGAAVTALLFTIGKVGIGMYLGHSAVGSVYGAAGSLAVLLAWFYYSAQIFLFGAEITKVHANRFGARIVPSPNAESIRGS